MSNDTPWDGKTERRRLPTSCQQELLAKLDLLSMNMEKVVRFIEGNGAPEKGAIIRLDRMEQTLEKSQKDHDRHSAWMWGSIGGLGLKAFWDFLTKPR